MGELPTELVALAHSAAVCTCHMAMAATSIYSSAAEHMLLQQHGASLHLVL